MNPCNDYASFHVLISFNTKQVLLESFGMANIKNEGNPWCSTACFSGSIPGQKMKIPQVSQHSKKKKKVKQNKKEVIYAWENVILKFPIKTNVRLI